jgi:alanine dehydrogenase
MDAIEQVSFFPIVERLQSAAAHDADADLILLSGRTLRAVLQPKAVIEALRDAYARLAANRADQGKSLAFAIDGGSAHVKAGLFPGSHSVLAAKVNVNLPDNWNRHGLPTIQGALLLVDAVEGRPLAVMDSTALTAIRTAATAMLAAQFGARKQSKVAAVIGCGAQAGYQVESLLACFPIEEIRIFDIDEIRARAFAAAVASDVTRAIPASSVSGAVDGADICITCTTSKQPVLTDDMKLAGCFVAAMGADNPEKCEIAPALMARARIFADDIEQCAAGGDLAHALRTGAVSRDLVHADLAALAAGHKSGRGAADELVIFDSCGSGVQDVAAAWLAYRTARANGMGTRFSLTGHDMPPE